MGGVGCSCTIFHFGTRSSLPLGKEPLTPSWIWGWVGPTNGLDGMEKSLALARAGTPATQPLARFYTDRANTRSLSRARRLCDSSCVRDASITHAHCWAQSRNGIVQAVDTARCFVLDQYQKQP
jgi:hypothetical protein